MIWSLPTFGSYSPLIVFTKWYTNWENHKFIEIMKILKLDFLYQADNAEGKCSKGREYNKQADSIKYLFESISTYLIEADPILSTNLQICEMKSKSFCRISPG